MANAPSAISPGNPELTIPFLTGNMSMLVLLTPWKCLNRSRPMKREFNVVIERDSEGYYVASVPELHGCHTQARSLDKLLLRIKEAIELCLEVEGTQITGPELIGIQRIAVEV